MVSESGSCLEHRLLIRTLILLLWWLGGVGWSLPFELVNPNSGWGPAFHLQLGNFKPAIWWNILPKTIFNRKLQSILHDHQWLLRMRRILYCKVIEIVITNKEVLIPLENYEEYHKTCRNLAEILSISVTEFSRKFKDLMGYLFGRTIIVLKQSLPGCKSKAITI